MAQLVKNPPVMQETWVQSLGWEDPLEKERRPGLSGANNQEKLLNSHLQNNACLRALEAGTWKVNNAGTINRLS